MKERMELAGTVTEAEMKEAVALKEAYRDALLQLLQDVDPSPGAGTKASADGSGGGQAVTLLCLPTAPCVAVSGQLFPHHLLQSHRALAQAFASARSFSVCAGPFIIVAIILIAFVPRYW